MQFYQFMCLFLCINWFCNSRPGQNIQEQKGLVWYSTAYGSAKATVRITKGHIERVGRQWGHDKVDNGFYAIMGERLSW